MRETWVVLGRERAFLTQYAININSWRAINLDEVRLASVLARAAPQQLYGIAPDITCLGKIIVWSARVELTAAAVVNRANRSDRIYLPGRHTSRKSISNDSGIALTYDGEDETNLRELEQRSARLCEGLSKAAAALGSRPLQTGWVQCGRRFFNRRARYRLNTANKSNRSPTAGSLTSMLDEDFIWRPSQFEAGLCSLAHTEAIIEQTIERRGEHLKL